MAQRLKSYLRTFRRTFGLSQAELGYLLGVSEDVVGNCERGVSRPSLNIVIGCMLIFGGAAFDIFPSLYRDIQDGIGRRAAICDRRWETKPGNERKLALLRKIAERTTSNTDYD